MKLVVIFTLLIVCNPAGSKKCIQEGQCKCIFDDGSGTVDLSPLGKQDGTALIQDQFAADNYAYSFNPCYPFTEGTCTNAAACQYDSANNVYYNIGDASKVKIFYDGTNVVGSYVSDDSKRSSNVSFICDPSADPPTDRVIGQTSTAMYAFEVTSKYACPSFPPSPTPTSGNRCFTNFGDFTRKCFKSYDGKDEQIKMLIIENWDGSCYFPANIDVAVIFHDSNTTCEDVISKCNPVQAFSVNGYVCKEVIDRCKINTTSDSESVGQSWTD